MHPCCPHCEIQLSDSSERPIVVRFGYFKRLSDSKRVRRFRCLRCLKTFSLATFHPCFRQLKRHKNEALRKLLCSGVSQRRSARILNMNRKTVARKLIFLGVQSRFQLEFFNLRSPKASVMEFDDLETFEHSKCKPLSVTLAVEFKTRRILGFSVSQMPAKGLLSKIAVKKYGPRKDARARGRKDLFQTLKPLVLEHALIKSDSNPHYPNDVKRFFPLSRHEYYLGKRGAVTGQGELKKAKFDPLFSLNHTCAMLRANICRLIRKTWCTTKKAERLLDHLAIYALYHNQNLNI